MSKARFINHCGAEAITLDQLRALPNPQRMTETHYPIRHDLLIDTVKEALAPAGYKIHREEYSLQYNEADRAQPAVWPTEGKEWNASNATAEVPGARPNDNFFGIMEFKSESSEISRVAGIRNSGTKKFLAQLGCGERVFVCDNLCFSAQIIVGRKHTRFIERDLEKLTGNAIHELGAEFQYAEQRVEVYKERELTRMEVHDVMMQTMRSGGCPTSKLQSWVNEFKTPTFEEFAGRSAWSLKNAFTELAKGFNHRDMTKRTGILTGVLDDCVDLRGTIEASGDRFKTREAILNDLTEVVDAEVVGMAQ